jgi:hypothetical protein
MNRKVACKIKNEDKRCFLALTHDKGIQSVGVKLNNATIKKIK